MTLMVDPHIIDAGWLALSSLRRHEGNRPWKFLDGDHRSTASDGGTFPTPSAGRRRVRLTDEGLRESQRGFDTLFCRSPGG